MRIGEAGAGWLELRRIRDWQLDARWWMVLRGAMPNAGLKTLTLAALVLAGWLVSLRAEDAGWIHRAWTTEDGLPDNSITGVAQSPDGFMWVATKGGLMRFDGIEFTPMPLQRFPEVPSRAVRAILKKSQEHPNRLLVDAHVTDAK